MKKQMIEESLSIRKQIFISLFYKNYQFITGCLFDGKRNGNSIIIT